MVLARSAYSWDLCVARPRGPALPLRKEGHVPQAASEVNGGGGVSRDVGSADAVPRTVGPQAAAAAEETSSVGSSSRPRGGMKEILGEISALSLTHRPSSFLPMLALVHSHSHDLTLTALLHSLLLTQVEVI